jgi:transcriptional regulator of nitric oxide reductase
MSDQAHVERTQAIPPLEVQEAKAAEVSTSLGIRAWLKGGLRMAICCAAPLLLIAAIAFFGLSLGALATGFLTVAALLVCPLAMFIMMRMMMKQ